MNHRDSAYARARQRAAQNRLGVGAAFLTTVRTPAAADPHARWRAAVAVVAGTEEAQVLVRSRARAMDERADPRLVAEIVERAVAARGDTPLTLVGQDTAGLVLEDHAPELVESVFARPALRADRRRHREEPNEARHERLVTRDPHLP